MAEQQNPKLEVVVDGVHYPFDFDKINGRQLGQIYKWCGITAEEFADGIVNGGSMGVASAAVYLSVDQFRGPLPTDEVVSVMDTVSVHSTDITFAVVDVPAAPAKKAPAKKAPAKKKAAPRSTAARRKATA
jgi:hypothetical protein